ncbi:hypothetical protein FD47_GL001992 [Lentilactobacillus parafarraginis DSM 18390 = JCM 14109]|jgi:uncharacterized Rmd1/YagE family protein|uniref:Uncharacterized protein n=1 Tax=Lentilactobacillus parafarraginis DSM 18390 = JCM 14109 TaxID=1423786 RepID=A0A0R1YIK7_9LACO|nr:hypothetical protein FD47_GL001992 [Lentilactobacillus parafarraginis DSM 18390 = JCM 14109]
MNEEEINLAKSQKIVIDPEKFAYHFIDSINNNHIDKSEMRDAAKKQLFAYLSAYVLAEQFNQSEASNFLDNQQINIDNLSMGKFLELISQKTDFNAPNM